MPFVENMDQEKDQMTAPSGPVSPIGGGGAVHLAPSTSVAPAGGGPQPSGTTPTSAGGQFATLNQYLTANQGQAEPLAGQITGGINKQYQNLATQNTSTLGDIGKQVSANAVPNASETIAAESANPVSFASNPSNIPSFQKLLNATYNGPASAESTNQYQNQQTAINQAIAQGQNATKTEAGREGLLQNAEQVKSPGVTALDSAILSQSPTALNSVETAYDPFSNLLTSLSGGAADVNKNIAQTKGDISSANAAANKAIADQTAALNAQVGNELTTAQGNIAGYNKDVSALTGAATSYNADVQDLLRANPQITNPTTADFSAWMNLQPYGGAPTLAQVATPQDYTTAAALQTLNGPNPVSTNINASTASQAGTALPVDYQNILAALSNGAVPAAMTSELSGIGGQITKAMAPFQAAQANADAGRQDFMKITGESTPNIYTPVTPQNNPVLYDANGNKVPATITQTVRNPSSGHGQPPTIQQSVPNPAWQALQQQANAAVQKANAGDAAKPGAAQGIGWVPQTATNYNNLLTKLQADLAPVGSISLPSAPTPANDNTLRTLRNAGLASGVATIPTVAADR